MLQRVAPQLFDPLLNQLAQASCAKCIFRSQWFSLFTEAAICVMALNIDGPYHWQARFVSDISRIQSLQWCHGVKKCKYERDARCIPINLSSCGIRVEESASPRCWPHLRAMSRSCRPGGTHSIFLTTVTALCWVLLLSHHRCDNFNSLVHTEFDCCLSLSTVADVSRCAHERRCMW